MVTDATTVQSVGTQAFAVPDDYVDTMTAEAMVEEALCMVAEAEARERIAEERARQWLASAELGAALLRKAEIRTECAQAERKAAEMLAAAEQAARQMAERMLAAEATLADAAVERALHECAARAQAEAQRDIWRVFGVFGVRLLLAGVAEGGEAGEDIQIRHRHHKSAHFLKLRGPEISFPPSDMHWLNAQPKRGPGNGGSSTRSKVARKYDRGTVEQGEHTRSR